MTQVSFSTALLAGGRSTRMGRDKALLPVPGSDLLLWQRQWQVLEQLQPEKMFWSGPPRPNLPPKARLVPDLVTGVGPLAGISACLTQLESDLLVILAVDLPRMTADYLRNLLTHSSTARGVVVRHGDFFEPLAAVYPRQLQALASEHLAQGRHALQELVREALRQNLLGEIVLQERDIPLFKNLNSPADAKDLDFSPPKSD